MQECRCDTALYTGILDVEGQQICSILACCIYGGTLCCRSSTEVGELWRRQDFLPADAHREVRARAPVLRCRRKFPDSRVLKPDSSTTKETGNDVAFHVTLCVRYGPPSRDIAGSSVKAPWGEALQLWQRLGNCGSASVTLSSSASSRAARLGPTGKHSLSEKRSRAAALVRFLLQVGR